MAELELVLEGPEGGRVFAFPSKAFVIGSAEACAVRLPATLVQPEHVEILRDERGQWWVRDVLSSGSVSLNGASICDRLHDHPFAAALQAGRLPPAYSLEAIGSTSAVRTAAAKPR